jgi:hypothetical protein
LHTFFPGKAKNLALPTVLLVQISYPGYEKSRSNQAPAFSQLFLTEEEVIQGYILTKGVVHIRRGTLGFLSGGIDGHARDIEPVLFRWVSILCLHGTSN